MRSRPARLGRCCYRTRFEPITAQCRASDVASGHKMDTENNLTDVDNVSTCATRVHTSNGWYGGIGDSSEVSGAEERGDKGLEENHGC